MIPTFTRCLRKTPTAVYLKQLNKTIEDLYMNKTITVDLRQKLKPTSTLTPRFYGLPQVHKRDNPLRPIVASRGLITYKLVRYVADVLKPLMGMNGYALKNSVHLVEFMKDLVLLEGTVLVSFDVTPLFTKVPVARSLKIIVDRLENDPLLGERTPCPLCRSETFLRFASPQPTFNLMG